MAPLPRPRAHTVLSIYRAYEQANRTFDGLGLSVGQLGHECDRALWYDFRWASEPEQVDGRKVSIFRTGDRWEDQLVADLEAVGVEVYGQQDRIRLVGNHVRGKIDGRGIGVPEAPKTEHLFEFKSSNAKGFREIKRKGCREAKPLHYVQCQLGMHAFGLTRAGYLVVNKDDDERYFERIAYDAEFCLRVLARAERIIKTDEPPSRVRDKPDAPPCLWCKHKAVCFENRFPRTTCRSCLHATPEMHGDAEWSCARWSKPLSVDEQRAGCPAHLFLPGMVPGAQVAVDEEAETVSYTLFDGRSWVDGGE
ncbi:oxidoreductase [Kaustia mangrovi]|uniref:Oxidoreductase n=1 Tax=Kaustia mangrovi TaxID=2593653 RepID=A0A7S8C4X4_9HYPH|nr:oxidoreductase [Kaustia mangrovi]QPC43472.1 oxidoreductase [Kaustia mangrovi]